MDWARAIDRNRESLLRIIAALLNAVGLQHGGHLTTLPFWIYRRAISILRPAESAVRRLIFVAAQQLILDGFKLRKASVSRTASFNFAQLGPLPEHRLPAFSLIEPLKGFGEETPDYSNFGPACHEPEEGAEHTDGRAPIPAYHLGLRLLALKHALDNLPAQARRLLRWYRTRDIAQRAGSPHRLSPMRPGLPPSWQQRGRQEIDDTLRECHWLARHAQGRRDSS